MAKHMEELGEDVASYAASCVKRTSRGCRAELSWRKTKTGRRRARRIASGVTQSTNRSVIDVIEPDDFERSSLGGRTIFMRTLRWLNGPGCRVRCSGRNSARLSRHEEYQGMRSDDVVNVPATSDHLVSAQSTPLLMQLPLQPSIPSRLRPLFTTK
eukprot:4034246-Amphidinium_carterae.2